MSDYWQMVDGKWRKGTQRPGWEAENELAASMGFTCVKDERRGGKLMEWSKFIIGAWHVWSIASWNDGKVVSNIGGSERFMAWQVAKLKADGMYEQHYTRRHLKPGEHGICGPGFVALKDALTYAKEQHEKGV